MNNKAQEKHTPGPWTFDGMWSLIMAGKYEIAAVHAARTMDETSKRKRLDEVNANARLISAAPELLEACRAVLANAEDAESTCDDDGKEYSDIAKLRAAIAKAEGRTL